MYSWLTLKELPLILLILQHHSFKDSCMPSLSSLEAQRATLTFGFPVSRSHKRIS